MPRWSASQIVTKQCIFIITVARESAHDIRIMVCVWLQRENALFTFTYVQYEEFRVHSTFCKYVYLS